MLPEISSEYQRSNESSWVGTAYVATIQSFQYPTPPDRYLLATCTFTPLYGRLCNAMGRRGANQSAVILSCMGILACGLSRSMKMLIISRFVGFFHNLFARVGTERFQFPLDIRNGGRWYFYDLFVRNGISLSCQFMLIFSIRIITSDMYTMRVRFWSDKLDFL